MMTLESFVHHCLAAEVAAASREGDGALQSQAEPLVAAGLSGEGYLVQHNLLDQLPSLALDVITPDVVLCGENRSCRRHVFFG